MNERYDEFEDQAKEFILLFGEDTINDFVSYWTESNQSDTKMRFEMQETFGMKRRLNTWAKNDYGNNKKTNGVTKFQLDANGKFYIGYCSKCNVSDFYDDFGIKQDSRCCQSKLLPERKTDAIT